MIQPSTFATIYGMFEDVDAVRQMLPTVLEESTRTGSAVVLHDCSVKNRDAMRALVEQYRGKHEFFFLQTDRVSMGFARNLSLSVAAELFVPEFVCMLEDDHGYEPGAIPAMVEAMREYYGQPGPSSMRYGLFTCCPRHWYRKQHSRENEDGHVVLDLRELPPEKSGKCNSCFRAAPLRHWVSVLHGYDNDEYPISSFQTSGLNRRNYHKGFTAMLVKGGRHGKWIERPGRGATADGPSLFHRDYARRDPRSGHTTKRDVEKGDVPER